MDVSFGTHKWLLDIIIYFYFTYPEYRNGWLIRTATKSFAVYAATQTEKQEWMAHINKCIEDLLRKSTNLYNKPSSISNLNIFTCLYF